MLSDSGKFMHAITILPTYFLEDVTIPRQILLFSGLFYDPHTPPTFKESVSYIMGVWYPF